jgi:Leucine-rich repeat (LRR) protein
LRGKIPEEIKALSATLNEIRIANHLLGGRLSDTPFAELTALTTLSLERNFFSGTVPWSDFSATLNHLSIRNNRLTGALPEEIGDLTKLEFLSFEKNVLTGSLPSTMGALTALTELALSENLLSGELPPELGLLTSLGTCVVGSC